MTAGPKTAGDWAEAIHAAFDRESDRAAAIVAGAMLDEALRALLEARLVQPAKGRSLLNGGNAPLGTYSARIDTAHQLGLISGYLARDLHIIRKIRNEFAHQPLETTFDTPQVGDWIAALERASDYNTRHPDTRRAMGPPGKSGDFLGIVAWILYTLQCDIAETKRFDEARPEFGYVKFEELPPEIQELLKNGGAT